MEEKEGVEEEEEEEGREEEGEGKEGIWAISRDKRWEMVRWISSSNTH